MSLSSATAAAPEPCAGLVERAGLVDRAGAGGHDRDLQFPDGVLGFAAHRRFRLEPQGACGGRCMRLQSIDDDELGFLVLQLEPGPATPSPADLEQVSLERRIAAEDLVVLLVVAVRPANGGWEISANLRAPIFIDTRRRVGWQVVLRDPSYPIRQPILRLS
jgi:flagellar assembly factor FliW